MDRYTNIVATNAVSTKAMTTKGVATKAVAAQSVATRGRQAIGNCQTLVGKRDTSEIPKGNMGSY